MIARGGSGMSKKKKLRPVLDGEFWMIGNHPDLGPIQGMRGEQAAKAGNGAQQCVDHHVFQSKDGAWHLWGCIRGTAVGRVLYHWESDTLIRRHWKQTGEMIRVDRSVGESVNDWGYQEWIQSPFAVVDQNRWYMFYGGHGSGETDAGDRAWTSFGQMINEKMDCQICLMTSDNGRIWTRHRNEKGQSRLFLGPGEARDPCLIKINDL